MKITKVYHGLIEFRYNGKHGIALVCWITGKYTIVNTITLRSNNVKETS